MKTEITDAELKELVDNDPTVKAIDIVVETLLPELCKKKNRKPVIPDGFKIYYIRDENRHPAVTVAIARNQDRPGLIDRAVAICSPSDYTPTKKRGRSLAINRLKYYRMKNIPPTFAKLPRKQILLFYGESIIGTRLNPTPLERKILCMDEEEAK